MWKFDAVVVSDLHLGARNSRAVEFLKFLKRIQTEHLVLAGDIFNHPSLRGMQPVVLEVLEALRDFSLFNRVDWVLGNHDPSPECFEALLGIPVVHEVLVRAGGGAYLVCHGHPWDPSLTWPKLVVGTADAIYSASQWIDPSHRLARGLKRRSKSFVKAIGMIRQRAVTEAHRRGLAGIILGHSHHCEDVHENGVHYLNCGCWTERPATFVGVRRGKASVYDWDAMAGASERGQVLNSSNSSQAADPTVLRPDSASTSSPPRTVAWPPRELAPTESQ